MCYANVKIIEVNPKLPEIVQLASKDFKVAKNIVSSVAQSLDQEITIGSRV